MKTHVQEDQYIILTCAKTTGVPICQKIQHYLANHVMPILAVCHVNPTIYLNDEKNKNVAMTINNTTQLSIHKHRRFKK
jgi:pyrimidine operon attenuation protein/uracil phosphoribosyltransferase